jgi:hypothetical protein
LTAGCNVYNCFHYLYISTVCKLLRYIYKT